MPNGDHIPTILGEGKAYLNGKEYDLSEFYASGLSDTLTEATNSDTVTPVAEAAERNLMPGNAFLAKFAKLSCKLSPRRARRLSRKTHSRTCKQPHRRDK